MHAGQALHILSHYSTPTIEKPGNLRLLVLKTMLLERYTQHRSLSVHIKLFKVVATGVHKIPGKKEKPTHSPENRSGVEDDKQVKKRATQVSLT